MRDSPMRLVQISSTRRVYIQSHDLSRRIGTIPAGVLDDAIDGGGNSDSSGIRKRKPPTP